MLVFLPPAVQALIGIVAVVVGLALHIFIIAGLGLLSVGIGTARWVRSRRHATAEQ
jgi:type IV secretory pathway TrbD component